MGLWNYDRKGKHDHEAGSSSGGRRGSVKEEAASPPCRASSAAPFTIVPRPAGQHDRQYLSAEVCRHYWETRTPVPWSDVHLPNAWHLFADQVPIPPVLTSGRARHDEIERCRRLLPVDLYYDDSTASGPRRAREVCGRTRVRGLTPTPSPSLSLSPPPLPRMEEEEARLMQHVMEDSMMTHDERQWPGLDRVMALSAVGDVAIPEQMGEEEVAAFPRDLVGQQWSWSCTVPEMAQAVGGVNCCPTPPRSPKGDASPREEVLRAPASFQPALAHQGPPAYVDLVSDGGDDNLAGQGRRRWLRHRRAFLCERGGAVRGGLGQVEKEPPDSASNRGNAAETFEFAINFFPSTAKLVDGSIENIQRDTIVKWEVDCAKIDPNEIQSMEENAVRKLVEKIGETVLWGREQEVGYVPSHLAMQKADDDWASQRHIVPIITDLKVIADGANAHAEEGNVNVVDWNAVELEEPTDLVIAPIADTEMAKLFGIPVDDRDEEERDEANTSDNDDRELSDVDEQLMKDDADDVDDAHDEELVHVYDKENPVIRVGKLWPNMDEFRLSFKTYAVRHQFDAKTVWTDRKKFYAKCRGFDGSGRRSCKWYISARLQPDGSSVRVNQMPNKHTCLTSSQKKSSMTSQIWVAEKITPILAKTPNTTAKRLQVDLEKLYPIKLHYTTVWKAKQRSMKNLYGDWANTFRLLFNFKAEVERRRKLPSQPIVVEQCWPTKRARVSGSRRQTSQWMEQFGAASDEIEVVHTVETIETEVVHIVETEVVHTVKTETEAVHTVETVETEAAIKFHEAIASSPVKKTKMLSELVCAVQPKTRNAKAKKGTRRGPKR
ncbi:ADP-ribosylation factor-related protein 1 [Hordeum vulgare]|nr:ADP-ribosylation factor-related protein 1 [Hordeum vulgare]